MADEKGFGFFLKFPFSKMSESMKAILLGYVPILNVASLGYVLGAARNVSKKKYELPRFSEVPFGQLFMTGLMAVAIMIVYTLIPNVLSRVTDYWSKSLTQTSMVMAVFALVSLVAMVVSFIFYMLMAAAMLRYLRSNRLSEGFEFKAVWHDAINWHFFKSSVLAGVASFVLMIPFIIVGVIAFVAIAAKYSLASMIASGTFDPATLFMQPWFWLLLAVLYILYIPSILFSWTCYYSYLMHLTNGSSTVLSAKVAPQGKAVSQPETSNGLAIASFVISILNLFGFFILVIPVVVSLILSIVALVKISKNPRAYGGKGFAVAALVLSLLEVLILIAVIALLILIIPVAVNQVPA